MGYTANELTKEVEAQKSRFFELVEGYNHSANNVMNFNDSNLNANGLKNTQEAIGTRLVKDTIPLLETFDRATGILKKKVNAVLNLSRYPLTNSTDKNDQLRGELQINSAITELNSLDDKKKIETLIANGLNQGRMDYVSALIDNYLSNLEQSVIITDSKINMFPNKDNFRDVEEMQKHYNRVNDWRLGLLFEDDTIRVLSTANRKMKFLKNQTEIFLKILKDIGFIGNYLTGYDLEMAMIPNSMITKQNGDLYKILTYYSKEKKYVERALSKNYEIVGNIDKDYVVGSENLRDDIITNRDLL